MSGPELAGAAASATRGATRRTTSSGESNTYAWTRELPQNNYDLDAEYGDQHLQLAAPDHPGADRPVAEPEDDSSLAYALAGGWNASAIVELVSGVAAERGAQQRHVGRQPGAVRRPAAAEPHRRSEHDGQRRGSRVVGGAPRRAVLQRGRLREPGRRASTATRRERSTRAEPVPQEHRSRALEGHAIGHGQPVGEIRFEILNLTNTAKFGNESTNNADQHVELRPHRDAGRVHADLAADVPLPVLKRGSAAYGAGERSTATSGLRAARCVLRDTSSRTRTVAVFCIRRGFMKIKIAAVGTHPFRDDSRAPFHRARAAADQVDLGRRLHRRAGRRAARRSTRRSARRATAAS